MKIEGHVAIVLGGARGIGRAYVEALLDKGAKVCIGDVLVEEGAALNEELRTKYGTGRALFVRCDVTQEEDIEGVFKITEDRLGTPEILVNNAAILNQFNWQKCLDVNLGGVIRSTHLALDCMRKDKGGRGGVIINTASISALRPEDWSPVYCATKYGLLGFTLSWALPEHYNNTGVRLNCICPTTVKTTFLDQAVDESKIFFAGKTEKYFEIVDMISPTYVAEGMVELIEDDTKNGQAMRVTKAYGRDYAEFQDQPLQ